VVLAVIVCSTRLVEKLNLQVLPHPKPYKMQWLNEDGDITVDKQLKVNLYVGNYNEKILCTYGSLPHLIGKTMGI